ncbi:Metallo-peptidase family M12 [Candidatus Hepatincola sp. Av]
MLPNLEIRVLFCYSPEVLTNTYYNLTKLQEDNLGLCNITQGIFRNNVTTYNVSVRVANMVQVDILQMQDNTHYSCLDIDQMTKLSECTTQYSLQNNPLKFGPLPEYLLRLKRDNQATIIVLQTLVCEQIGITLMVSGASATIDVKNSKENVVCVGRTSLTYNLNTNVLEPLILAHELGHLMGCLHPYNPNSHIVVSGFTKTKSNNSSHGHCILNAANEAVVGTIMSYAQNQVFYYSNPNIFEYPPPYQNIPCGIVGESEAYKIVNNNIQKLAGIFTP